MGSELDGKHDPPRGPDDERSQSGSYQPADDEELSVEPTTPWERLDLPTAAELAEAAGRDRTVDPGLTVDPGGTIDPGLTLKGFGAVRGAPAPGAVGAASGGVRAPGGGGRGARGGGPDAGGGAGSRPEQHPEQGPDTEVEVPDPAHAATVDAAALEMTAVAAPQGEPPRLYAPHMEPDAAGPHATASEGVLVPERPELPEEPDRIGPFQVLRRLGAGGMGVVLSAYDERLDRRVALKILRRRRAGSHRSAGRIKREAQALAKLSHPNVVPVFEVGEWQGQIYLAMEHVEGVTLRQWSQAATDWRQVLAMHVQAGRGLDAAHAAGLVHRDYKPANVLVGNDGRARVLDFGLVRARTSEAESPEVTDPGEVSTDSGEPWSSRPSALHRALTQVGAVMGTPAYMSPEQRLGKVVDARSDQYSFCVVLYEALHGHHPFEARTPEEQFHRMMDEELDRTPGDPAIPREVADALARGMRRSPDERWPSMQALIEALERALARDEAADPSVGVQHRVAAFAALSAVTLVILVGLFIPRVRDAYIYTRPAAVIVAVTGLALVLGILALGRDTLLRSSLNRKLFWWLSIAVGGMVLTRVAALALGTPFQHVFIKEQALILVATAMAGVLVDAWAWWIAAAWAVGLAMSLFVVPQHAVVVSTCAVLVSCLFAGFLWGRGRDAREP